MLNLLPDAFRVPAKLLPPEEIENVPLIPLAEEAVPAAFFMTSAAVIAFAAAAVKNIERIARISFFIL